MQELPAPPGEYVPGGHEPPVGDTPPGASQSCPGGQELPIVRPAIGQYAPIEHCRAELPPLGQYVPGGQVNLPAVPCTAGLVLPLYNILPPAPAGGPGQY